MSFLFPQLQVGQPLQYRSITLFPLFAPEGQVVNYQLADEAMNASTLTVKETGEAGTVPELIVDNLGDTRVLFIEGEELRGAKQNRVLNTSLLARAKSKTRIPVSCVEQGRWRYTSSHFSSSDTMSSPSLRYKLKSSVTMSLKKTKSHRSDQGSVWSEVGRQQDTMGVQSPTMAMSDTYSNYADQIKEFREQLRYLEGCCGVVVAIGPQIVSVDMFDKPETCQRMWERLLSGHAIDALGHASAEGQPEASRVEQLLQETAGAKWDEAQAVGEGQEYRTEFTGHAGSALLCDGAVVHLSVVAAR